MIKGTTRTGFNYEVDETRINDMEYLELLAKATGNIAYLPAVVEKLLGREQKTALYEHVRDENGRVSVDAIDREIEYIMSGNDNLKNF